MSERLLHHRLIEGESGSRSRLVFFLHGILGAGRNWTSVALRMTRVRPDWGAVLVDLRLHGESVGFSPPHTLEACAADVRRLVSELRPREHVLLGHSFGGKVALVAVRNPPAGLRQAWVVESTPEPGGGLERPREALRILGGIPGPFPDRHRAVDRLVDAGLDRRVAEWLATGLERTAEGFRWRYRFAEIEQLLEEFSRADLWPIVEAPPPEAELLFVRSREGSVLSDAAAARLAALEDAGRPVRLFELAGGHWLNADNPQGMIRLLRQRLPAPAGP